MACILCGNEGREPVYRVHGIDIVRCDGCGLVYTAEQPAEEDLLRIYGEEYFTGESEHGVDYVSDARVSGYDGARFAMSLDRLETQAPGRGRLLDVGCATGNFLLSARDRGWDVYGSELSADASRIAADRHGLNVFAGPPSEAGWDVPFDAITMNHVLEHIPDPEGFLRDEIAPLLAPAGVLMIEVPNFGSIHSRVNRENWADLRPEQHLYHFTADSLGRLLERSGFSTLEVTTLAEPQTSILGPLVYLHVREPVRTPEPGHAGRQDGDAGSEGVRPALRRLARSASMPLSRHYARRLMELRLLVIARPAHA